MLDLILLQDGASNILLQDGVSQLALQTETAGGGGDGALLLMGVGS